jgi:hypothetical protein
MPRAGPRHRALEQVDAHAELVVDVDLDDVLVPKPSVIAALSTDECACAEQ